MVGIASTTPWRLLLSYLLLCRFCRRRSHEGSKTSQLRAAALSSSVSAARRLSTEMRLRCKYPLMSGCWSYCEKWCTYTRFLWEFTCMARRTAQLTPNQKGSKRRQVSHTVAAVSFHRLPQINSALLFSSIFTINIYIRFSRQRGFSLPQKTEKFRLRCIFSAYMFNFIELTWV